MITTHEIYNTGKPEKLNCFGADIGYHFIMVALICARNTHVREVHLDHLAPFTPSFDEGNLTNVTESIW